MNVLSLFDGMSCGQIALNRSEKIPTNYFASEIDKFAISVTQKNFPNTIQLGSVIDLSTDKLPKIDLLIGGSPCQDLSGIKNINGKGLDGEKSKLFFEYVRVLKELQTKNPDINFLLENVIMKPEYKCIITEILGVQPIEINSGLLSAQNRPRLYWTNIPNISQPDDKFLVLDNILESEVDIKYFYDKPIINIDLSKQVCATLEMKNQEMHKRVFNPKFKVHTLTACGGGNTEKKVLVNGVARKMTPLEYERAQTVPDNYTEGVSNSQRYKMLGNGWTVDIIAHIFKNL